MSFLTTKTKTKTKTTTTMAKTTEKLNDFPLIDDRKAGFISTRFCKQRNQNRSIVLDPVGFCGW